MEQVQDGRGEGGEEPETAWRIKEVKSEEKSRGREDRQQACDKDEDSVAHCLMQVRVFFGCEVGQQGSVWVRRLCVLNPTLPCTLHPAPYTFSLKPKP